MALIKTVEDLQVFNRAYDLALEIHKMTQEFPGQEKFEMASQMRRASKGICTNITKDLQNIINQPRNLNGFYLSQQDQVKK